VSLLLLVDGGSILRQLGLVHLVLQSVGAKRVARQSGATWLGCAIRSSHRSHTADSGAAAEGPLWNGRRRPRAQ
jgi:hypothetical protein